MSPIKYADVLYVEDDIEDEHDQKYIPEVLLHCYPKRDREDDETNDNEIINENNDSPGYGTFDKDLVTDDAIVDTEKLIAENA